MEGLVSVQPTSLHCDSVLVLCVQLLKKIDAIAKGEDPDSVVEKSSSGCVLM